MAKLQITTINVRGMTTPKKLSDFQFFLNHCDSDVLLLQKIHKHDFNWLSLKFVFSPGSSNARGVAIIVLNRSLVLSESLVDQEGRIVSALISTAGNSVRVLNIYAPNVPTERKSFFFKGQ